MSDILVVIVNYRTAALTKKCLAAVARERAAGVSLSAVVVDGHSQDGSAEQLRAYLAATGYDQWTRLLPLEFNGGFGWANNQAILSQPPPLPPYIHLLNPDAEIEPGAIAALRDVLDHRGKVAAAGSHLINPDGTRAVSAFRFPTIGTEFIRGSDTFALHRLLGVRPVIADTADSGPVDWVTGASVMLRSAALEEIGLFDDGFFLYFEEVELMNRLARQGWQVWSEAQSKVQHIGGASTGVTGNAAATPKPAYWFASRNRYFAVARGKAYAAGANLAWLAGRILIAGPRRLISRSVRERVANGEARQVVGAGILPASPTRPSAANMGDAPGQLPLWFTSAPQALDFCRGNDHS